MKPTSFILKRLSFRIIAMVVGLAMLLMLPLAFSNEVLSLDSHLVQDSPGGTYATYLNLVIHTFGRVLGIVALCFTICFIIAATLSILIRPIAQAIEIAANGMRFLPAVAWLPVIIALVGVSTARAQLFFVALGVIPVVLYSLLHGFSSCPQEKLLVARLSGASRWRTFSRIVLPNSSRDVFYALRLGLGLGFVLVVVHEFIFPSVFGVARVVEILEIMRYSAMDGFLFTLVLLAMGILLDQGSIIAYDVIQYLKLQLSIIHRES